MAASQARRERRAALQQTTLAIGGGGYGQGNIKSSPATGSHPSVNPFMLPKQVGLNQVSNMFPSDYYRNWDLSTWREACDQAIKMGFPISYAALTSWAYESSPFIQSLFNAIGYGITEIPLNITDSKGNINEAFTNEICNKRWFIELRKEIAFAKFWGFTGINFDPTNNRIYKYPMQQIDPINRLLRAGTYNFSDGASFAENDNLIFVQHSTNYESFLGWMQPITRSFIQSNMSSLNWVQAGKRLAFPLMTVMYPGNDNGLDSQNNEFNEFRTQAENYSANIDPSSALVTPYVIDQSGKIQSSLIVDMKDTTAKGGMHKIFQEFKLDEQNEIREMILGGTLTGSSGKVGSQSLGEVHMDKFKTVISAINEEVLAVLNDPNDFLRKLPKFYKNFPKDAKFDYNRTKTYSVADLPALSTAATQNGIRLTDKFFLKLGLDAEDMEEAPAPVMPQQKQAETLSVEFAKTHRNVLEALKKKY